LNDPRVKGGVEWWRAVLMRLGDGPLAEGASAEEIAALDARLGRPVSTSYRALLQASNGFPRFGERLGRLLPAAEVDWFPKRNPGAAPAVEPASGKDPKWRVEIPLHSIEIAETLEGARLLLHPKRGKGGGEWEVWFTSPSACTRFPTLPDFVEGELRSRGKRS